VARTYHLTPRDWWAAADPAIPLGAPSLLEEGFIHCTSGAANMVATANRHYHDDPRDFVILGIELDALTAPWRVEDPEGIYPHVFGPIDRAAIESVIPARRDRDGAFQPFDA
jgi:uncharacterized protein (DUF952 family)